MVDRVSRDRPVDRIADRQWKNSSHFFDRGISESDDAIECHAQFLSGAKRSELIQTGAAATLGRGGWLLSWRHECQQHDSDSRGLNLLVAAIILWNTVYLQRAIDYLRGQGYEPTPNDLAHLSPVGWEHINLTGDYHWETSPTLGPDQFRPLRTQALDIAIAA